MRDMLTRERLRDLMQEIARRAPRQGGPFRVFLVRGGTAVLAGWREASVDADFHSEQEAVFHDIQAIKEALNVNVEFVRPEYFVPPLPGAADRHVFIEVIGPVHYYHYDPCSQVFAKVVRGFDRDLLDARAFVVSGMVDPEELRRLVEGLRDADFARYPSLSPAGVRRAMADFLASVG
ncbi:MAG: hypothetical protein ACC662_12030 [Planctomycetota bacterium]